MSNLKIKAARNGKYFGEDHKAGDDLTDRFEPDNFDHRAMLTSGALLLVKETPPKRRTKRNTRSK